ncbi:hypothetical protein Pcinc_036764 [Petrolisthes cinctipes]|uniref:Uncharacterized protein n=1 Tax=Petrolisthes cinctipes TaxID=88211 RepID=A0AAE1BXZ6_PETCI|nr:hypothetical protein Pcinc_036764 [Petrolisthes cinctipes]
MGTSRVVGILMVCCLVCVAAQTQLMTEYNSGEKIELKFEEVRNVLRDGFPLGREYNVRVRLADHQSILGITSWRLTTLSDQGNGAQQTHFTTSALSIDQAEIDFEADLTGVYSAFLTATNGSDYVLGIGYGILNKTDMESRLAWVGGDYDPSSSSIRVWPGKMSEVKIGKESCKKEDAPCYYISASLPQHIPRCLDVIQEKAYTILQCDDIISLHQESSGTSLITVSDGNMTINVKFTSIPARIEAAVFDPKDPTQLFSPNGYHCPVIKEPRDLEPATDSHPWTSCKIPLKDTKDRHRFMVLVVALDDEGYVYESRMEVYDDTPPKDDNVGVIVGSVVGGICGLAIIVAIVVYFFRDKEAKKAKRSTKKKEGGSTRSTAAYQPAPISDPVTTTTTTTQPQQHEQEEA